MRTLPACPFSHQVSLGLHALKRSRCLGFLFVLVLLSCRRRRWHLCFVLFALSCPTLGSLACPHAWNCFISPSRPQIGFAEIVLAQDRVVMLNKLCPAVGLVPVAVVGTSWDGREWCKYTWWVFFIQQLCNL